MTRRVRLASIVAALGIAVAVPVGTAAPALAQRPIKKVQTVTISLPDLKKDLCGSFIGTIVYDTGASYDCSTGAYTYPPSQSTS